PRFPLVYTLHCLSARYHLSLALPYFFFSCYGHHRDLHSFPTRRSSDLAVAPTVPGVTTPEADARFRRVVGRPRDRHLRCLPTRRSEEHTSELQSRENLVCRLLLEKKKAQDKRQRVDVALVECVANAQAG